MYSSVERESSILSGVIMMSLRPFKNFSISKNCILASTDVTCLSEPKFGRVEGHITQKINFFLHSSYFQSFAYSFFFWVRVVGDANGR